MKENAGANGFFEESQTTYHVDACTPACGNNCTNCCEDERLSGSVAARKHKVARDVVPIASIYVTYRYTGRTHAVDRKNEAVLIQTHVIKRQAVQGSACSAAWLPLAENSCAALSDTSEVS